MGTSASKEHSSESIVPHNNPDINQVRYGHSLLTNYLLEKYYLTETCKFDSSTLNIVKNLLKNGADPNVPVISESKIDSPFYIINNLSKNRFDPKVLVISGGRTLLSPLYVCCKNGFTEHTIEIIKLLLEYGANPEPIYTDITCPTPLLVTLMYNNTKYALDIVILLLKHGASTEVVRNNVPLMITFLMYHNGPHKDRIRKILIDHQNDKKEMETTINRVTNNHTMLALQLITTSKFDSTTVAAVRDLLKNGADPNVPAISDVNTLLSPLYLCCANGFTEYTIEIIKLLFEYGAHVRQLYDSMMNYSPLMILLKQNNTKYAIDIAILLLKHGADTRYLSNMTVMTVLEMEHTGPNKDQIRKILIDHQNRIT